MMPALAAVAATLPPTEKKKGLVNKVKRFTAGAATAPERPRSLPVDAAPERAGEGATLRRRVARAFDRARRTP